MTLPLFVYGTLRSDGPQAGLLGARRRERAVVRGTLYRLPAGYPALDLAGDTEVRGELVHDVDDRLLRVLDRYEDVEGGLYRRAETDARVGLDRVRCVVYVMDRPWERGGREVPSGWWAARRR